MSRNKHISKKTPCFSRKRSKKKAKPNEFERCILKLSCYACSDTGGNKIIFSSGARFQLIDFLNVTDLNWASLNPVK